MTVDWRSVNLWGAGRIGRVVGTYEVFDARVPSGGLYQIKVIEEASGRFTAHANVGLKGPDGFSAAGAGMGRSEVEALGDFLKFFSDEMSDKGLLPGKPGDESDFVWVEW